MKANGLVLAAAGSAIGAFLRFLMGELLASESSLAFPVSTLLANLLGCLLIGLLAGRWVSQEGSCIASGRWHFWITGVCGGFTTFSAFSSEVLVMMLGGRGPYAGLYAAASIGMGIFAVWAGLSYSLAKKNIEQASEETGV